MRTNHPTRCTITFDGQGPVRFGGEATHTFLFPRGVRRDLHHVLTIPVKSKGFPFADIPSSELPLYFPLRYGFGAGGFQYLVEPDGKLRFLWMRDDEADLLDEADLPHPRAFPVRRGTLRVLTYEESRVSAFADVCSATMRFTREDKALLQSAGWLNGVQLGGQLPSNLLELTCRNPACNWAGKSSYAQPLAVVRDSPARGVSIFGSSDVSILFGYCAWCGAICAENGSS